MCSCVYLDVVHGIVCHQCVQPLISPAHLRHGIHHIRKCLAVAVGLQLHCNVMHHVHQGLVLIAKATKGPQHLHKRRAKREQQAHAMVAVRSRKWAASEHYSLNHQCLQAPNSIRKLSLSQPAQEVPTSCVGVCRASLW